MKIIAVIPARYASTRLPAKPLIDIHGKPMIQWVYERVARAQGVDQVVIATDDARIEKVARQFIHHQRDQVLMTSSDIHSGTDRVAAVADVLSADVYINVQGDEPLMEPVAIEAALGLVTSGRFSMSTVMTPLTDPEDLNRTAVVKVIADKNSRAIYFSRHGIPYSRGPQPEKGQPYACRRHVGLYVYTRETLMQIRKLPPSPLEKAEVLEQLRAMEEGIAIGITEVDFLSIGVDLPEDLENVRNRLRSFN